jgi:hypothetical protein
MLSNPVHLTFLPWTQNNSPFFIPEVKAYSSALFYRNSLCIKNVVSVMLLRAGLVRTDVSEQRIASITRMTRIGELGTTLDVTTSRSTQRHCCHPDDGNNTFLGNVGFYNSHTA